MIVRINNAIVPTVKETSAANKEECICFESPLLIVVCSGGANRK